MVSMASEAAAPAPSSRAGGTLLMSMTEIAELAQVRRPVVTTWRRRYADFPQPVGRESNSLLLTHVRCPNGSSGPDATTTDRLR